MKLIDHVLQIRSKIERAFDNRFSRMGFKADEPEALEGADDETKKRRKHIGRIIAIHEKAGNDYPTARKEALNECVFTLFNRLAAIKVMETKELFPEVLLTRAENGNLSFSHNSWLEENPDERNAERMGLKHFIRYEFSQLAGWIPIYRDDYPYDLLPTADELHDIISDFNAIDDDPDLGSEVWKGDDILGWQYENFNTAEKLALKDSGDKVEYDKVSLQSQVYTPRWTVKFLVDNSLGHLYLEMYPDSEIVNMTNEDGSPKYLIANAPKRQTRSRKPLTELRVIDPACGSGNFLIYAFILLYDMYLNQIEQYGADYSRRDIPKLIIENNLYGIDLDERAVQLTQVALLIKAREIGGRRAHMPEHINVVSSHFTLPEYSEVEDAFVKDNTWDSMQKKAVEQVWNDLRNAYKFGSLVRVEEKLKELRPNYDKQDLFSGQDQENIDFRTDVAETLQQQVRIVANNSSDDYSSRQVNNALTFLKIISQTYDVAVANPPYTDSAAFGPELKKFVNDNYSKPYKVNVNLYAVFIKRCFELTGAEGKIAMINPPTFMYIKTFEGLRKLMIEKSHIDLFVEWGYLGLFTQSARVDSAFFCLDKRVSDTDATFIKLNDLYEMKRKGVLDKAYSDLCSGQSNDRVYFLPQSKLKEIKSWPFIYWISDEFREKFVKETVGKTNTPVIGIMTGDNNRFLRFSWELNKKEISSNYQEDGLRWIPYHKGGPYVKWYGNLWLVVDYANKGELLNSVPNNKYLFKKGVTFGRQSTKGASYRIVEGNELFDNGAPCIISQGDPYVLLGFLNSNLSKYILECLNPTVNKQSGDIIRMPFSSSNTEESKIIGCLSQQNVDIKKELSKYSLIEPLFATSPIIPGGDVNAGLLKFYTKEDALLSLILLNEAVIESNVLRIYELNEHDRQMVLDKEGIPVGDLSVSHEAKQSYLQWLTSDGNEFNPTQELLDHINALEENDDRPKVGDFDTLYLNNNGWEEFCIKHKMNPIEVWWQFKNARVLPPQRTQVLAFELITDVMRTVLNDDDDGIIPLGTRIGEEQMSHRIEQELQRRGYSNAQISQIVVLLGDKDLETYLREHFFQQLSDHLNLFMYLPKTPFIWHLSSGPLHALDVMVSIYTWSRNTLTRIKSVYAARRESQLTDRLSSLTDTSNAKQQMEAGEIREQIAEIHSFVAKIDDLLASGYDPILDDGVGKNIAPLQKRGMLSYDVLNPGQLKKYLNADW